MVFSPGVCFAACFASAQAVFFVHEKDAPDRPFRPQSKFFQQAERLHRLNGARAVVMRSLSLIPAVEMSSDNDHFARLFGAPDFTDDICGFDVGKSFAAQFDLDADIFPDFSISLSMFAPAVPTAAEGIFGMLSL